jgi:preprotein translocase subunit SecE
VSWVFYLGVALVLVAMVALVIWRDKVKSGSQDFAKFLSDVVAESKKISWPTREELRKYTVVILMFVVLVALIIGTMDIVLQWLLVSLPSHRS